MVQTGYVPDEEAPPTPPETAPETPAVNTGEVRDDILAQAEQVSANDPPPASVASVDVLAAEPSPTGPEPTITVRDRTFRLRRSVPGILLMKLSKTQMDMTRAGDNKPEMLIEGFTVLSDTMFKIVVAEDREPFKEWLEDAEPPIDIEEVLQLVKEMIEKVTGRPPQ